MKTIVLLMMLGFSFGAYRLICRFPNIIDMLTYTDMCGPASTKTLARVEDGMARLLTRHGPGSA